MTNHYTILGIDPQADATHVRAAYKRMAMAYHPDHNPGNPEAEEIFKRVNEAYQTLSNPLKRAHYDAMMFPQFIAPPALDYERPRRSVRYPRADRSYYRIDKEYFRMQALSLLVFVTVAGFCFVLMNAIQYMVEQRRVRAYQANTHELKHAGTLFADGRFEDAFTTIRSLTEKAPLEYRMRHTLDSLTHALRKLADARFDEKDYTQATTLYLILRRYEDPLSVETLRKIAMSQYYIGNFAGSLAVMKELHKQYPDNPELVYSIALMSLDKIQNLNEAMQFFELGKSLYHRRIKQAYGISFANLINPGGAAEVYFDILQGSARCNIIMNNFDAAVQDCDDAARLRPEAGDTYRLRALANARRRKMDTVCQDLAKARRLGATDLESLEKEFCL